MKAPARTSETLLKIRQQLGFRSALSFFKELRRRGGIEMNYAQYRRIEASEVRARPEFIDLIEKSIPEFSGALIRAYCADLFPSNAHFFVQKENLYTAQPLQQISPLLIKQVELTPRQVDCLANS